MKELLLEVIGWLGYLERPAVLLQVLVVAAVLLLYRQLRLRPPSGLPPLAITPLALGCLALIAAALTLVGMPAGLALLIGQLWLGWYGLSLLNRLLARWLPPARRHQLNSRLLRPLFILLAIGVVIDRLDSLSDLAVIPLGQVFGVEVSAGKVFNAVLVVYLVLVGCGPPAAGLAWLMQRAIGISEGSRKATELILRYAVVSLGLLAVALHLGFNGTAMIAVAGGLSVGLGFGVKEVFSNFVSGLWLLFEGSVRPGEVLILEGDPCEVRRLGLRATLLWRPRDNAELLVPNQTFFTTATTSYTASDRMRRSQVSVGAAYQHDPAAVIALLESTALTVEQVLEEPAPKALLLSYGDSAIQYALRFWIANPMDNGSICSEVNQAIWRAFAEHGIEIPFPQQVAYAREWPGDQP